MEKENKKRSILTSHAESFRFKQVPFGLMNAPKTLQRALDNILNKYTWKFFLVYPDNISIFLKDNDLHRSDIENIFSTFYAASVSLKLKKRCWSTARLKFLVLTLTPHKLRITVAHAIGLKEMKHPRTLRDNQRFVLNYFCIAASLNRLLKKGQPPTVPPLDNAHSFAFKS